MGKLQIVILLVIAVAFLALGIPAAIDALPDRYVSRLPEPLQKYGLPKTTVSLLPTASAVTPIATADLSDQGGTPPTAPALSISDYPASIDTEPGSVESDVVGTPTPTSLTAVSQTTPTATPSATATATTYPLPSGVRLEGFQHKFQTWNNCGPATLAMALSYFGDQVSQEQTAAVLKPDPEDRNVTPSEMVSYVEEQTPHRAVFRANGDLDTIKRLLANDIPVIVEIGIEPPGEFRWLGWYGHYLLLVAYDDELQQFWAYDSWFGTSEEPLQNAHPDGRGLSYDDLEANWAHFNRNYIALYDDEQSALVSELIGGNIDDEVMWSGALARSQADVDRDPTNAFYWFNLGTNYAATQQYDEAAAAFDQARAIGLPWRMLWYQFGPYESYYNVGRYEDVILLANTTLEDRPYFEESYYYKGLALDAMGERDMARENLERAARFNPNFERAQNALAELD